MAKYNVLVMVHSVCGLSENWMYYCELNKGCSEDADILRSQ